MGLLNNKKILITGLANKYSIASGIAQAMHREGAELAFMYQNERLLKKLEPIAESLGSNILLECDVSSDDSIDKAFSELKTKWGTFDGLVHSIGFAPSDQLKGSFVDVTTREGFQIAHDVSSYSFTALAKASKPILNDSSALLTLTYLGSVQTLPNYNVMGLAKASLEANTRFLAASMGRDNIRVNAIAPGYVKTDITNLPKKYEHWYPTWHKQTPMNRMAEPHEIASAALFLCSPASSYVTGEVLVVDGGYTTR